MSISVVKICSQCRSLVVAANECPNCKATFQPGDVGLPVPMPVRLQAQPPAPATVAALQNEPHQRRAPSAGEAKKAIRLLLIGIIGGPLATLFGIWVISNFVGFGVLFFGYLPALAGPCILVAFIAMGLNQLLRDGRKKTPEKAFEWVWKESYFAPDDFSFGAYKRYETPDYAYGSLLRALPASMRQNLDKEAVLRYLGQLRAYVDRSLDDAAAGLDLSCNGKTGQPFTGTFSGESMEILSEIDEVQPLGEGISLVTGSIRLRKNLTSKISDNDTYHLPASEVRLTVTGAYVQNGRYWFPCDVMPLFAEEELTAPAQVQAAPPPLPGPVPQAAPGPAQQVSPAGAIPPGISADRPF